MTYEQSHIVGRRVKPDRKKKKNTGAVESEEALPPLAGMPRSCVLPLSDHKSTQPRAQKETRHQNDASSTIDDRLRSPTSSSELRAVLVNTSSI